MYMNVIDDIKEMLKDKLDTSGTAFYSSASTLKQGKYLIVGLNPGGADDKVYSTIGESLINFLDKSYNAYYETNWDSDRLPKNLKTLFNYLDVDLREVCATNLIYERSKDEANINISSIAVYIEVLKKVISIVKPKAIITFGAKPYEILYKILQASQLEVKPSGHGDWQIFLSEGMIEDRIINLLGLPHLSRYVLYNKNEQLNWIKEKIG